MSRNGQNPPLQVRHADLERSDDSVYRSLCPVEGCGGALLVRREPDTGRLAALDSCLLCGQHVVYTDIEEVRQEHG